MAKIDADARHYLEKLINIEVLVPTLTKDQAFDILGGQEDSRGDMDQEPPAWVNRLRQAVHKGYDIARFGVFGVILALVCVAAVSTIADWTIPLDRKMGKIAATNRQSPTEVASSPVATEPVDAPPVQQQAARPPPSGFRVPDFEPVAADELREPWRWLWWGPTLLAVAIVILWGAGAALQSRARQVRDSPAFKAALGIVHPLVFAAHGTPRAIKRFQNRMRYLAVRLNPPPPEVDPVERLLYRLGNWLVGRKWLKHSWVPESRVALVTTTVLDEPKLILLGGGPA